MPFDPDQNIREIVSLVVAGALLVFRPAVQTAKQAFDIAEEFAAEAETRHGKLNPGPRGGPAP
jgi:hypothetical protein